jgi:hypothetical protein
MEPSPINMKDLNNGAFTYKHEEFHQPAGGLTRQDLGHKGYRVIVNMGAMGVENICAFLQHIYEKNLSHTKFLPDFTDLADMNYPHIPDLDDET